MEVKKIFKESKFYLKAVIIGTLITAFWEFFIRDMLLFIGSAFVKIVTFVYAGYIDILYEDVGKGSLLNIYPSLFLIITCILLPITLFPFLITSNLNKTSDNESSDNVRDESSDNDKDESSDNDKDESSDNDKDESSDNDKDESSDKDKNESSDNVRDESFMNKFFTYLFEKKYRTTLFIFIIFLPISIIYTHVLIKETSTLFTSRAIERNLEIIRPFISDKEYYVLRSDFRNIDNKQKLVFLIDKINVIADKNNQTLPKYNFYGIDNN